MKTIRGFLWIIFSAALFFTAGCATSSHQTTSTSRSVGPAPTDLAARKGDGYLQVFSSLELAPLNVEMSEYIAQITFPLPQDDVFLNDELLHTTAHTSYSIYSNDNKLIRRVFNSKGLNDAKPEMVALPPGNYFVEANTEDCDAVPHPVIVPVGIKAGLKTTVHFNAGWQRPVSQKYTQVTAVANGGVVD